MAKYEFHYSNILPTKPGIRPEVVVETVNCRRCGVEFTREAKTRIRCNPCQAEVNAEQQKRYNERLRARRKARRDKAVSIP